jgi:hypothetical protein
MLTVSIGRPLVCSTLTSAAPWREEITWETCWAVVFSVSMSSPKIFTATSLRTPEISELKRSWMGCENS